MSLTITVAVTVWNVLRTVALAAADTIISLSLLRTGARPRPGTRTAWPKGLKEDLALDQGGRCVYCRSRLSLASAHIDHMTPVNQGGSNCQDNLQLLCPGCNLRKSDRSDAEFRARYRRLLPQGPRVMPGRRIKDSEFRALADKTEDVESYARFKAGKYLTPGQKVNSGALGTFAVASALLFFPLNEVLNPGDASSLLLASLGVGALAGIGVRLRAWWTGRDQED